MKKRIISNPFATIERRQMEGEFFKPKRPPTMNETIVKHCLSQNITPDDFILWFRNAVAPTIEAELDKREQQRYEQQQNFKAQQKIKNMPENRIPAVFLGRKAYPQKLKEIENEYTLNDWFRVRRMAIEGKYDTELCASRQDFILWLNATISRKCQEEPDHKSTKDKLRELLFRKS